jgi:hypothetical protein
LRVGGEEAAVGSHFDGSVLLSFSCPSFACVC